MAFQSKAHWRSRTINKLTAQIHHFLQQKLIISTAEGREQKTAILTRVHLAKWGIPSSESAAELLFTFKLNISTENIKMSLQLNKLWKSIQTVAT